ncbi:MAG: hypothetical protein R2853_11075 [Thermomicrobiales bacterium]
MVDSHEMELPGSAPALAHLGDFTATARLVRISLIAIVLGAISTVLAVVLLQMIGFFTNIFFYGRISTAFVSPAGSPSGRSSSPFRSSAG